MRDEGEGPKRIDDRTANIKRISGMTTTCLKFVYYEINNINANMNPGALFTQTVDIISEIMATVVTRMVLCALETREFLHRLIRTPLNRTSELFRNEMVFDRC